MSDANKNARVSKPETEADWVIDLDKLAEETGTPPTLSGTSVSAPTAEHSQADPLLEDMTGTEFFRLASDADPDLDPVAVSVSQQYHDIQQQNEQLMDWVSELEESLNQCQTALQFQRQRSQELETLLAQRQKSESTAHLEAQVNRALQESQQQMQKQHILVETLTQQLDNTKERVVCLEQEYGSLQRRFADQTQRLVQSENECRALKTRLSRQQRYTLQFKAALERCLEVSVPLPADTDSTPTEQTAASPPALPEPVTFFPRSSPVQPWSAQGDSDDERVREGNWQKVAQWVDSATDSQFTDPQFTEPQSIDASFTDASLTDLHLKDAQDVQDLFLAGLPQNSPFTEIHIPDSPITNIQIPQDPASPTPQSDWDSDLAAAEVPPNVAIDPGNLLSQTDAALADHNSGSESSCLDLPPLDSPAIVEESNGLVVSKFEPLDEVPESSQSDPLALPSLADPLNLDAALQAVIRQPSQPWPQPIANTVSAPHLDTAAHSPDEEPIPEPISERPYELWQSLAQRTTQHTPAENTQSSQEQTAPPEFSAPAQKATPSLGLKVLSFPTQQPSLNLVSSDTTTPSNAEAPPESLQETVPADRVPPKISNPLLGNSPSLNLQPSWPSPLVYPLRPPKKRGSLAAIELPRFPQK